MPPARADKEPDLKTIRCVPRAWCTVSKVVPVKLWDDTGAGGGKAGSIWLVNGMDMIAVIPGHEPPREEQLELNSSKFYLEGMTLSMRGIGGGGGEERGK